MDEEKEYIKENYLRDDDEAEEILDLAESYGLDYDEADELYDAL